MNYFKKNVIFYLIIMLVFSQTIYSQIDTAWTKTFDYGSFDSGLSVVEISDSSFLLLGRISSADARSVLIKTDFKGNVSWNKSFNYNTYGEFSYMIESNDNSIYVIGNHYKFSKLYKIDFEGNIIWSLLLDQISNPSDSIYISSEDSVVYTNQVLLSEDNGVYLVGKSGEMESRIWTAKVSSGGEYVWINSFPVWLMLHSNYVSFIKSLEGFFIMATDGDPSGVFFYRVDNFGNLIDEVTYRPNGVHSQSYNSMTYYHDEVSDSGYVLVGEQMGDLALIRVDVLGNVLWSKTYSRYTASMNFGNKIIKLPNGSFTIIGGTGDNIDPKMFILNTDLEGTIQWENVYENSYGEFIEYTGDNGYIACGTKAKQDIWLLKLEVVPLSVILGEKYWFDSDWDGIAIGQLDGSSSTSPNGFPIVEYIWSINGEEVGNDSFVQLNLPTGSTDVKLKVIDESGIPGEGILTVQVCSYKLDTEGSIISSISTIGDSIFFASSTDDQIYCFSNENQLKWTLATGGGIQSTTTIGPNGNIYVGSNDTRLYCFDPKGNFKWDTPMGGVVSASPAITQEKTIYVGTENNRLYSVNGNDGNINWNYLTGGAITSSVSLSKSGDIYFGSSDKKFYSLKKDGALNWSYTTPGEIHSTAAIDTIGRIFFGSNDGKLYSLLPNGSLDWSYSTSGAVKSSPVIDSEGNIYFGSDDGKFYCVSASGSEVWNFEAGSPVNGNPSLTKYGNVLFGCDDGNIFSLNLAGELNWSFMTENEISAAPLITDDGRIYVGSSDNSIYGFIDPSSSSENYNHFWPTFQKDTKRTGSQTDIQTSVKNNSDKGIPNNFALQQNYPNPFNPTTKIEFQLSETSKVELSIYSITGEKIKTLSNENKTAGYYSVKWNGLNDHSEQVGSGIYIFQMRALGDKNNFVKSIKMIKLK